MHAGRHIRQSLLINEKCAYIEIIENKNSKTDIGGAEQNHES
jgi:hypothetical protein